METKALTKLWDLRTVWSDTLSESVVIMVIKPLTKFISACSSDSLKAFLRSVSEIVLFFAQLSRDYLVINQKVVHFHLACSVFLELWRGKSQNSTKTHFPKECLMFSIVGTYIWQGISL